MRKYNRYSLALNDDEDLRFKKTGLGVKKIFMAMINVLVPEKLTPPPTDENLGGQMQSVSMEEEE